MTTAGELLYNYLAEKHKDKLFTERHVMIAVELARLSDDEFFELCPEHKKERKRND